MNISTNMYLLKTADCSEREFKCANGVNKYKPSTYCIPIEWRCDADIGDCTDGSDESSCPGCSSSIFIHTYMYIKIYATLHHM